MAIWPLRLAKWFAEMAAAWFEGYGDQIFQLFWLADSPLPPSSSKCGAPLVHPPWEQVLTANRCSEKSDIFGLGASAYWKMLPCPFLNAALMAAMFGFAPVSCVSWHIQELPLLGEHLQHVGNYI